MEKKSDLEKITEKNKFEGSIEVRAAYEQILYIDKKFVVKNENLVTKWKVFTSKGNGGAGLITDDKPVSIIGDVFVGAPGVVCTDSLIPLGDFDTENEALALQKYMKTKFFRTMVGSLKTSQNIYQNVYAFTPIQNFKENGDINWESSIENLDKQLYKKYMFTEEEILFIDDKIKSMK